jgi:hypothetical protein
VTHGQARRGTLVVMRVLALLLLALVACRANPAPARDVSDFCGIPASACGKRLVDEHGVGHTVNCTRTDQVREP